VCAARATPLGLTSFKQPHSGLLAAFAPAGLVEVPRLGICLSTVVNFDDPR
jgi:hypothetical protein